jgi:hypothetical protein
MYIQHIQGPCQFGLSTAENALLLVALATIAVNYQSSLYSPGTDRIENVSPITACAVFTVQRLLYCRLFTQLVLGNGFACH